MPQPGVDGRQQATDTTEQDADGNEADQARHDQRQEGREELRQHKLPRPHRQREHQVAFITQQAGIEADDGDDERKHAGGNDREHEQHCRQIHKNGRDLDRQLRHEGDALEQAEDQNGGPDEQENFQICAEIVF
mgnify:CR=1 FL=1